MSSICVCRACLNTTHDDKGFIFLNAIQIALFNYTLGVQISEQQPPGYLCPKCATLLEKYGKFKKKCLEANSNYLLILLKQSGLLKADPLFKPELVSDESSDNNEVEALDPALPLNDDDNKLHVKHELVTDQELELGDDNIEPVETSIPNSPVDDDDGDNQDKSPDHNEVEALDPALHLNDDNNKQHLKHELVTDQELELGDDNIEPVQRLVTNSPVDNADGDNQNVEDKTLKCDLCCQIIKNKDKLAGHLEKCSKKCSNFVCGLCAKKECNQKQLNNHFLEHFKDNMLKCKRCTYSGRDFADMVKHSYDHTKQHNKICPCCLKRFLCLKQLEFHFRSVHLHKEGGLCSYCNKAIATTNNLMKHERLHLADGYVCDHCGKKFLYRYEILHHLRLVAGITPYMCDSCGMQFKRKSNLKAHRNNKHENQNKVKCSHCNKLYKSKAAYQRHVKEYTAEREHKCLECNKTFIYARHLKKHAFFHTDVKPFHCSICDKHYKTKASFKEHERRHAGFKPFKCKLCEMDFVTSTQLKVHQSVHTGVRLKKCSHCHRTFNSRMLLKQHCWKVHKIELKFD